ncbi:MAG: sulfatase-like hydrolase/transferase [Alphaproteobacteria bacterium]|nr:sulfatase-like hydrolase/transferase [Alphaproteobacteria bacterium]
MAHRAMLAALGLAALSVTGCANAPAAQAPQAATTQNACPPALEQPFAGVAARMEADSRPAWPERRRPPEGAPNILVWMVDDLGFGQLSAFGGLIETPTLDALAASGLAFTNYNTPPVCSPARAALLTGRNSHAVNMGPHAVVPAGYPGYNAHIPATAATFARVLQESGYATYAFGKWDHVPHDYISTAGPFDLWPLGQGFDQFYGFMAAEDDHFAPTLWRDNALITDPSLGDDYFLTSDLADRALTSIASQSAMAPDQPWLIYWATGAIHYPHQAPADWIERYHGRFDMGWDAYRETVLARQIARGIVPRDATLPDRPQDIPSWASLSADQRRMYARQMEVAAAQLSHADHEFGRIIARLRANGELDNTLILVMADNGASAEGAADGTFSEIRTFQGVPSTLQENLARYDQWGGPHAGGHYSNGWALAGNTPFRYFKQTTFQGGIHVPLIVHWPAGMRARGELRNQYVHAIDLGPTILDAAGVSQPQCVDGVRQQRVDGASIRYAFDDARAPSRRTRQYYELWGNAGLYEDGWYAVYPHNVRPYDALRTFPLGHVPWELYNLSNDFNEQRNLAAAEPERLARMMQVFEEEGLANNVFPQIVNRAGSPPASVRVFGAQTRFEFPGGTSFYTADGLFPTIRARSHTIEADITRAANDQGVIIAAGGGEAGFTLYVAGGRLHYEYNYFDRVRTHVQSPRALPAGNVRVGLRFIAEAPPPPPGRPGPPPGAGRAMLLIDGRAVAEVAIARSVLAGYSAGNEVVNIGRDTGTPVSTRYTGPFAFTGDIARVVVTLDGQTAQN